MTLTEQQEMIRQSVRRFAEAEIAPVAAMYDARERFHGELVPRFAAVGLFGLLFPEAYGGSGADTVAYSLALQELARVDSSAAATVSSQVNLAGVPIVAFGTEEQKGRWLPALAKGERLGAFALTEPGAGSDARSIRTRARRQRDDWVLNGTKCFITNAGSGLPTVVVVAARTGEDRISNFIVPGESPGLRFGPQYRKMGWRASATSEVIFEDCRVPGESLLGQEGHGFHQFMQTLDLGRIAIASFGVGLAQGCLEMSLAHARTREQFGQPIARHQAIQFKLADMDTRIELSRLITLKAAWRRDQGLAYGREAAMAKLHASETANEVARQAVQVHGGYGFMEETPVARFYRDAKVLEIGEGTSEIQRIILARHLLGEITAR